MKDQNKTSNKKYTLSIGSIIVVGYNNLKIAGGNNKSANVTTYFGADELKVISVFTDPMTLREAFEKGRPA